MLETSEQFDQIAAALALAEAEFTEIEKDSEAEIAGEAKGSGREFKFTFEYASLAAVLAAVRPALTKNGIALLQPAKHENQQGAVNVSVQTWLVHKSGQWFRSPISSFLTAAGDPKKVGIMITYARRYQLGALLGVAPEEDKEADGSGQKKANVRSAPPPARPPAPRPPDRTLEPGQDPQAMSGGSESPAQPDATAAIRAALKKQDWQTALTSLTAMPPGPAKDALKAEYHAARHGNGKGA